MAAGFRFHHHFVSNTHIFFSVAEKQISYQTTHDSTHRLLVLEKIGLMCGITCGESEGLKIKMARHCLMRVLPVSCLKLGACQRWVKTNIVEIWWNWIKLAHGFMLLVHHTCVEVLKNTIARCQRRAWLQYESEKKKRTDTCTAQIANKTVAIQFPRGQNCASFACLLFHAICSRASKKRSTGARSNLATRHRQLLYI